MSTTGKTKKTQVVRRFSRFIAPGSVRVEATPAYGDVMASAYVAPGEKALTIVLINPKDAEVPVTLKLRTALKPTSLQTIRTSATEDCQPGAPVAVSEGNATLTLPGQCIVTLTRAE